MICKFCNEMILDEKFINDNNCIYHANCYINILTDDSNIDILQFAETEQDGIWKTINGSPIFIKDGQSIDDAIKEKFNNPKTLTLYHGDRKTGKLYNVKLNIKPSQIINAKDIMGSHDNPLAVLESLKHSNALSKSEYSNFEKSIPDISNMNINDAYDAQDKWLKNLRVSLVKKGYKTIRYKNQWEGKGTYSYAILDKSAIETDKQINENPNDIAILHIGSKKSAQDVLNGN